MSLLKLHLPRTLLRTIAFKALPPPATRCLTTQRLSRHLPILQAHSTTSSPFLQNRPYSAAPSPPTTYQLTDAYNSAQDDFDLALDSTIEDAPWAAADREAARESLENVKRLWRQVTEGGGEGKVGIGRKIEKLETLVTELEGKVKGIGKGE